MVIFLVGTLFIRAVVTDFVLKHWIQVFTQVGLVGIFIFATPWSGTPGKSRVTLGLRRLFLWLIIVYATWALWST